MFIENALCSVTVTFMYENQKIQKQKQYYYDIMQQTVMLLTSRNLCSITLHFSLLFILKTDLRIMCFLA